MSAVPQPNDAHRASVGVSWWDRRPMLLWILLCVLGSRFVLTAVGVWSTSAVAAYPPAPPHLVFSTQPWLQVWGIHDTARYLRLAEHWYQSKPATLLDQSDYAFWPLYPGLIRLLDAFGGSPFWWALILSNACLIGSLVVIERILRPVVAVAAERRWAIAVLILWPMSFIFSAAYAESLFLFLIVSSFWLAGKQRWWLAGTIGGLAALTRPLGVFLLIPLLWMWYSSAPRRWQSLLGLSLVPIGYGLWSGYNWLMTGSAWFYVRAQQFWPRAWHNPVMALWSGLFDQRAHYVFYASYTMLFLVLLWWGWKKMLASWRVFAVLFSLLPLLTGIMSMPRLLAIVWPVPVVVAWKLRSTGWRLGLVATLAIVQAVLFVTWVRGYPFGL